MIYADNAATTRLDPKVFEVMKPFLTEDYANASQPYSFSRNAKKALNNARAIIAECINAEPEEIFFTSCGTESDNWAIKGFNYKDRKQIITSAIEHHAVLHSCKAMERNGHEVIYLKPDHNGVIKEEELINNISDKTGLVSIMYVNNEVGTVEPIKELCKIAHDNGSVFHCDAVQAVGHIRVDVKELGVDMLSSSAHKFNGPKGVGFLYIRKGTDIFPYQDGGAQEMSMRAGTENVAYIVGMAEALRINCEQMEENEKRMRQYEMIIKEELNGLEYRRNGGDRTSPGNMSLSFKGKDGEAILHLMDLRGICISTGSACTSGRTSISHVLEAMGIEEEWAKGTIRISLGRFNNQEEAHKIGKNLYKIINRN